jgi:hypothetical protein
MCVLAAHLEGPGRAPLVDQRRTDEVKRSQSRENGCFGVVGVGSVRRRNYPPELLVLG